MDKPHYVILCKQNGQTVRAWQEGYRTKEDAEKALPDAQKMHPGAWVSENQKKRTYRG